MSRKIFPQLILFFGITLSYIVLFCGSTENEGVIYMNWGNTMPIVVALIAVAGSIIGLIVQFKKDSNTIGQVKADTSELKPKTDHIDENVKKIRDAVVEKIVPNMKEVEKSSEGINQLVAEMNHQNRIKSELSIVDNRDYVICGIDSLYIENAKLANKVRSLEREKNIEHQQNLSLSKDNKNLRLKIENLQMEIFKNQKICDIELER